MAGAWVCQTLPEERLGRLNSTIAVVSTEGKVPYSEFAALLSPFYKPELYS